MVSVNPSKCIGCGLCESLCPRVFEMNKEGKAQVRREATDKDKKEKCVKDAINSCPVGAIK